MARLLSSVAACVLAVGSVSATSYDETWSKDFSSRIDVLPKPVGDCSVCFYQQKNFAGPKFCVGKRAKGCTRANPIVAPATIESIKFGKGCDLVVNVRVSDMSYDEHVDVVTTDVVNTGYNLTTYKHAVQELYVEEAGRACFLGIPESGDGFGLCYTGNVPVVEDSYRDAFTEVMLFKSEANDFDVIAYENDYYNSPEKTPVQQAVSAGNTPGTSHRFTGYSKELETNEKDGSTGLNKSMQRKVRSIKFVAPRGEDLTAGSVAPAPYSP
jgi:hypothetical protein